MNYKEFAKLLNDYIIENLDYFGNLENCSWDDFKLYISAVGE